TADWIRSQHYYVPTTKQMAIDLLLALENRGLTFADDVRAGLITWCLAWPNLEAPASVLRQSIDAEQPVDYSALDTSPPPWTLAHVRSRRLSGGARTVQEIVLGPFDVSRENLEPWPVPVFDDLSSHRSAASEEIRRMSRGCVRLSAALYVTYRGSEP